MNLNLSSSPRRRRRDHTRVYASRENDVFITQAIDMVIQATQPGADLTAPTARTRVACGASSYHGPASTSPGGGIPLGAAAKGLTHPVRYPVPSPFLRYREESDEEFHERLLAEFIEYLDTYEHELGVRSRRPAVPSRRRRDSSPGMMDVGRSLVDF